MARRLSMVTRDELLAAIRSRYGEASRAEKARILDELVAVSGYHRKHAIRLVGSGPKPRRTPRPARRRYDGQRHGCSGPCAWARGGEPPPAWLPRREFENS
jgi:hypothetical protein